jgi:hypothetical protein
VAARDVRLLAVVADIDLFLFSVSEYILTLPNLCYNG